MLSIDASTHYVLIGVITTVIGAFVELWAPRKYYLRWCGFVLVLLGAVAALQAHRVDLKSAAMYARDAEVAKKDTEILRREVQWKGFLSRNLPLRLDCEYKIEVRDAAGNYASHLTTILLDKSRLRFTYSDQVTGDYYLEENRLRFFGVGVGGQQAAKQVKGSKVSAVKFRCLG